MELPKVFAGRYTRGSEIASGGNSSIYECTDSESDKLLVLKLFSDTTGGNQEFEDSFQAELSVLRSISHPNIASIHDGGVEDAHLFLVIERVPGTTLRKLIKSHEGPIRAEQALMLTEQIAAALKAFQDAGMVHGHLDSRAVLVDGDSVKLAGFYPPTVSVIRRSMTSAGGFIVDPAYISPEQVSGSSEIDYRSDLYSLGVLLFEMVTGKKPFIAGNAFQAAMMRVAEAPPSPSSLNAELNPILDAAIVKALSKAPEGRFQCFDDFLHAAQAGQGSVSSQETIGSAESAGRIGSETVGVGISTDEIRKMLETRDQSTGSVPAPKMPTTSAKSTVEGNAVPQAATVGPSDQKGRLSSSAGDETMVGGIDVQDLPASFMIVDGPRRGSRFMINSEQSIIGSDASCAVSIKQKGVPPRFALLVRKQDAYVLTPFGSKSVSVNGSALDADEEHTLVRGDVIDVGPCVLRFVAPGEVFTLQDDVADRTIDRAQSKIGAGLKVITALIAVLCLGLVFLFQQGVSDRESKVKKAAQSSEAKKRDVVAKLRKEGDELFKEGKFMEPIGANARTRFEQILEIDPNDTYAKRRLNEIKQRVASLREQRRRREGEQKQVKKMLAQADQYFSRGDYVSPPGANAKAMYLSVLRIDSANEVALAKLKEIDEKLGTMLTQVNTLLAKAKQLRRAGKIVSPAGNSAHDQIKEVLKLNPGNADAQELLLDMAAECIYRGDSFKKKAKPSLMKKQYLKAQMLGADPTYLAPRMRGAELMRKSSSSVIIFDGDKTGKEVPKETAAGYLDSSEIERRVASWKLKDQIGDSEQGDRFIELP